MLENIALPVGLVVAGLCHGLWRSRRAHRGPLSSTARRLGWSAAALALALPVVLLMLAKLSGSAVMGWMFGLSLMAGLALLPCAALVGFGSWAGASLARLNGPVPDLQSDAEGSRPGPAPTVSPPTGVGKDQGKLIAVQVDRESVHAGDDGEPHGQTFLVEPHLMLSAFLHQLRRSGYFPSITGGDATWLIASPSAPGALLGVCAQQWPAARLTPDADVTMACLFHGKSASLHFRYWCQVDPEEVHACLLDATRGRQAIERLLQDRVAGARLS